MLPSIRQITFHGVRSKIQVSFKQTSYKENYAGEYFEAE